jgi:outer membrane lipoprotein-sorting protein
LLLPLVLLVCGPPARADDRAEEIVRQMDRRLTSARDQYFEYEMVTRAPGKSVRRTEFSVYIKGNRWRRLEFHSPGDIRSMRVLIRSLKKMYVYLPAYHKIRRVASHVRDQGFMGSAFSHDDMSVVTYGDKLKARLVREEPGQWVVDATRRQTSDYRYPRLRITILKGTYQPAAIEYFNKEGVKVKSERRSGFECRGQHCNPRIIALTDHARGVTSTLKRTAWKVNTGVPDSLFTVRGLLRGQ